MKFIQQTDNDVLTLSADNLSVIKWWVDGSYAVHPDCKSQTGATMSMGTGSISSSSQKQKINARSSTKTELVSVAGMLPQVLWTRYFLEEQGINAEHIIYQDNTSTQKLAQNGRTSSRKQTKHMNIRYFFTKDRVDAGDFKIENCSTKHMWADYCTKPLQGKLFNYFRALVMGFEMKTTDGKKPTLENFIG